jgi:hypothetical protein
MDLDIEKHDICKHPHPQLNEPIQKQSGRANAGLILTI